LRGRATRLYKHAMAAKLLAPVYARYFAAEKALERNEPVKAKKEIEEAKRLNALIIPEFERQKKFVREFPQMSSSFLSYGLRVQKPFELLTKKINEFRIPNNEELEKTSVSGALLKKLEKRDIKARQTKRPPVIDGKLDDECWKKNNNPASNFFRYPFIGKPKLAYDQTIVKVCYDNKNLYVAIRAYDNDFDSIRGKDLERDDNAIFNNDAVEIFLNPNPKNKNTAQFVVNASGAIYDSFTQKHTINRDKNISLVKEWNPKWQRATSLDDKGWITEMAIPFECLIKKPVKELATPPKPGDVWRAYFSREKRGLELSGVKFIRDSGFTATEKYPRLLFLK